MEETLARIERYIEKGDPVQHVVINAAKINLMKKDPRLLDIVNSCPLISADGISIVWAARLLGIPVPERVAGIDLLMRLSGLASDRGYKVYLFGAKKDVVGKAKGELEKRFPGLQVAGCRDGYFSPSDEPEIVREIAASGADILFVGFSSPGKEYWIHRHLGELRVPFAMGVGGSFDVLAGVTKRAGARMQRLGLEWLCRLLQEPRRMLRRYAIGNAEFAWLVLSHMINSRRSTPRRRRRTPGAAD